MEKTELELKRIVELKEIAKKMEIVGYNKMKKAQIVEALIDLGKKAKKEAIAVAGQEEMATEKKNRKRNCSER